MDNLLGAVADSTRRAILARLATGDARVTEVAADFPISLNSVSKHVRMLERAGLVRRTVRGRDHVLSLDAAPLAEAAAWIAHYQRFWEDRLRSPRPIRDEQTQETEEEEIMMNDVSNIPKVVVRREIAAPAEELFDAWLDRREPGRLDAPAKDLAHDHKVDPRVGGNFEIIMHAETGPIPHTGTYKEIDRPRRLVFTWNSPYAGQGDSLVTVEFRPARGATEIVLTHERLPSAEMAKAHEGGWSEILV